VLGAVAFATFGLVLWIASAIDFALVVVFAIIGGSGGLLTGCIGGALIRASDAAGATPSLRRDLSIGALVGGGLAALFGIWVLAESDHDVGAVFLVLVIPTALAAGVAAAAAAWIWRQTAKR
jgi:hypothetical protein